MDGCSGAWVGSVAGNAKRVALAQVKQPGGGRTTRLAVGCTLRWPDGGAGLPPDWRTGGGKAGAQGRYLHAPPSKSGALGAVKPALLVLGACGHQRGARQARGGNAPRNCSVNLCHSNKQRSADRGFKFRVG